jgi:PAS domain S-box-containing protein
LPIPAPSGPVSLTDAEARQLLDAIPDAFLVLDGDWRITYVNREAERINRKRANEFIGRTHWDEWPASIGSEIERQYRRAIEKQVPVHFEHRYIAPGYDVWLDIRAYPFRSGLAIYYRDISARKRSEEQLRQKVEELQAISEKMPVAIAVSQDPDCRDIRLNAVFANMLGLVPGSNVSRTGSVANDLPFRFFAGGRELRPEELPQQVAQRERRQSPPAEMEVVYDDGRRLSLYGSAAPLFDVMGRVRGSVAAFLDVTALRSAEEQLRQSEERYRSLVSATSAFVWTSDAEGTFSWPQPAWEAYTGQTWDEYQGDGWIEAVHPDDRERVKAAWSAAVKSRSLYQVEWRAWNAAMGQWRHCSTRGVPVLGTDGEVREWIGAVTDAHERKLLEAQLQHEARMKSLGVLAGGVAHDFNNLLVGILGNASLAMDAAGPKAAPLLEQVIKAGEQAAHLTRQMLAYAGKGQFVLEAVDVSREVRKVVSLLHSALPPFARLDLQLAEALPAVRADRGQIQQIAMNLIINAGEALPPSGGRIRITTERRSGMVALIVEDEGSGMKADLKERIFEPFFTTKSAGRGLGLAAVRGIVDAHGGRIELESSPESGTIFRVLLPGVPAVTPEPTPEPSNVPAPAEGTVLVVDDEPVVVALAKRTFAVAGLRGLYAESGREGIRLYREHASEIDAVVLDVLMPDVGGLEVLRALREIRPDVQVILSSGNPKAEIQRYFGEHAPSGFLPKPYRSAALVEAITACLRKARAEGA